MKKIVLITLTLAIIASNFFGISFAESTIKVVINEKELITDTPAKIVGGRTVVPLRGIFEALGAKVSWEGSTQTITGIKEDKEVVLSIGKKEATVNGKTIVLDVAAMIIDGRTMVPARFVAESLGSNVGWESSTSTVKVLDNNIDNQNPDDSKSINKEIIDEDMFAEENSDDAEVNENIEERQIYPLPNSKWVKAGRIPYNEENGLLYQKISGTDFINRTPEYRTNINLISATTGKIVGELKIGNNVKGITSVRSIIRDNMLYGISGSERELGSFYKVNLTSIEDDMIQEKDIVLLHKNYKNYYAGVRMLEVIDEWLYFISQESLKKIHINTGEIVILQDEKAREVYISETGFIYLDCSSGQYNLVKTDLNLQNKEVLAQNLNDSKKVWRTNLEGWYQIFVNDDWIYISDLNGTIRIDHEGNNREKVLEFSKRLTYKASSFKDSVIYEDKIVYGLIEINNNLLYNKHNIKFLDIETYSGPIYSDGYAEEIRQKIQSGEIERDLSMDHFREIDLALMIKANNKNTSLYNSISHTMCHPTASSIDYIMNLGEWAYFQAINDYPTHEIIHFRVNINTKQVEKLYYAFLIGS